MIMNNWYCDPVDGEVTYEDICAQKDSFAKWNYEVSGWSFEETGYEDVIKELSGYTYKEYQKATDKDAFIQRIKEIYLNKGIYPIRYFSDSGIYNEIEKCIAKKVSFNGNSVKEGTEGIALCKYLFPNLAMAYSCNDNKKGDDNCIYNRFFNEVCLERAIKFALSYEGGSATPSAVLAGVRLAGGSPSNFRPMNAKAIYEKLCTKKGAVILDTSSGFGGRLLGCLSSKNNYKYIGLDPNVETMYHLHQLGEYIEQVTGRTDSFELHCVGSEVFKGKPNSIDFMFTSPPYFDLEHYSDDETQCYNKFNTLDSWMNGFVKGTLENIKYMLKPGSRYAVNIADFYNGGTEVSFVDDWSKLSEKMGMPLVARYDMEIMARAGSLEFSMGEGSKKEGIYVFQKKDEWF